MEASRIPSCRVPRSFRAVLAQRRFVQVSPHPGFLQVLLAGWGNADTVFQSPELALKFSWDRIVEVHVASSASCQEWFALGLLLDYVQGWRLFTPSPRPTMTEIAARLNTEYDRIALAVTGAQGHETARSLREAFSNSPVMAKASKSRGTHRASG